MATAFLRGLGRSRLPVIDPQGTLGGSDTGHSRWCATV
ncbi:hypothetical protein BSU04_29280 [Caballeronia sordidicola]|uniref:Uncharacterized protein n=1 Tax=Caballeronia sordidicola TaxID=196367 RepID=A0A226WUM0_CABSO|nr:hypothetical protein BSU04_29280 [Caballeronia sordidicola]